MANIEELKDEYLDHMMNPRNYGKIENPDAIGVGNNPFNNELVKIYISVDDKDIIKDLKFEAIGCMSTIVTGSIFTDMVIDESIDEVKDVSEEFIKNLVNAPIEQRACGEMVAKAFLASTLNLEARREGKDEKERFLEISSNCYVEDDNANPV